MLEKDKCLSNAWGTIAGTTVEASGYEIHMGRSVVADTGTPFIRVSARNNGPECDLDGTVSSDGRVMGTYFHGVFDEPAARQWFLSLLEPSYKPQKHEKGRQESYELLAAHFSSYLDLKKIFTIIDKVFS